MNYYELIVKNKDVTTYLSQADKNFIALGFTEQGVLHAQRTAELVSKILTTLNFSQQDVDIGKTAGYLHDIGCAVAYKGHAQSGAILCYKILTKLNFAKEDVFKIVSIIGSHEDINSTPISDIASAVVIADKTDVRRERVIKTDFKFFDAHDRVHYAVTYNNLDILEKEKKIVLNLTIDDSICTVIEYFDLFISRIEFCRRAAAKLGFEFNLYINAIKYI